MIFVNDIIRSMMVVDKFQACISLYVIFGDFRNFSVGENHPYDHMETSWRYPPVNVYVTNYGKSPCLMGKSTISIAMFNSYFDITRGYVAPKNALGQSWAKSVASWLHGSSKFDDPMSWLYPNNSNYPNNKYTLVN